MELIHVHIYEPHKGSLFGSTKKGKAELYKYTCKDPYNCGAYQEGFCINIGRVFGAKCPNGRSSKTEGFTQQAKGYHGKINEWKESYSNEYKKLTSAPSRVFKVSGGWFFPYRLIDMNKDVPFPTASGFFKTGLPYLLDVDFTPEVFSKMIRYRPEAVTGGEIKSYQSESVPKLIKDLSNYYPYKFKEVADDLARSFLDRYNYIGRKVYLKTVVPNNEVVIYKKTWWWDGKTISRKDKDNVSLTPISWESNYVEFTPDDNAKIVIHDNCQVDENTKLAD